MQVVGVNHRFIPAVRKGGLLYCLSIQQSRLNEGRSNKTEDKKKKLILLLLFSLWMSDSCCHELHRLIIIIKICWITEHLSKSSKSSYIHINLTKKQRLTHFYMNAKIILALSSQEDVELTCAGTEGDRLSGAFNVRHSCTARCSQVCSTRDPPIFLKLELDDK